MKWQEIVRQLHALHIVILAVWHDPSYDDEIVRLNARLFKILGKNYKDLPQSLIENCVSG